MFSIIYADPSWRYRQGGRGAARNHYPTMTTAQIAALPVRDIAADDCALFLWGTMPNLLDVFTVVDAWGFAYKTAAFVWVKTTKAGTPAFGGGHYTRANAEACFLALRGRLARESRAVPQVVLAPRGRHSAKPPIVRDRIVQLFGDLPRVELFARERVAGWSAWGNEVESDIELRTA